MTPFELARESSVPLVDQIVERLSALIHSGELAAGTRLPSIRRLAVQVGASPFTVVDAYDRLVARGLIASRAGRGFYVAARIPGTAVAIIEALPDPGTDALALLQAVLGDPSRLIAAGSGFLPDSWVQELTTGTVLSRLARSRRPQLWATCPPQGLRELREQLSAKLQRQGIPAAMENVLTTIGASQAFDLLCRSLLAPGDVVLVEDPGYFVLFEQLRAPPPATDPGTPDAPPDRISTRSKRLAVPTGHALFFCRPCCTTPRVRAWTPLARIGCCRWPSNMALPLSKMTSMATCTRVRRCAWRRSMASGT